MVQSVLMEGALEQARSSQKLTYADYLQFPDDGLRHELINGEHYVTPPPTMRHQQIASNLHYLIRHYLEEHPIGKVFFAPVDLHLSDLDVVEPDILFVSQERADRITLKNLQGAADLVIEILSPSTRRRDKGLKRALYERVDVREYWMVNPDRDEVEVFTRSGKIFHAPVRYTRDQILVTPLLPGLELAVNRIFT